MERFDCMDASKLNFVFSTLLQLKNGHTRTETTGRNQVNVIYNTCRPCCHCFNNMPLNHNSSSSDCDSIFCLTSIWVEPACALPFMVSIVLTLIMRHVLVLRRFFAVILMNMMFVFFLYSLASVQQAVRAYYYLPYKYLEGRINMHTPFCLAD